MESGLKKLAERVSRQTFVLPTDSAVPALDGLLNESVLAGGKRFRPLLCMAFGAAWRVDGEALEPFARAAERVHGATLAHDDVMDEAAYRRGRRTLNLRASNVRAILGGDYLLARALQDVSRAGRVDLFQELSDTLHELVTGEWLQEEARGVVGVSYEHLLRVAEKKTASLMRWCCLVGAHLATEDQEFRRLAGQFGLRLGVGFQMMDDVLDFSTQSGKEKGKDLKEGLINFVSLEILQKYPALRPKVEDYLNKEIEVLPWGDKEALEAQALVKEHVAVEIKVCWHLLGSLKARARDLDMAMDESSLANLEQILREMGERNL